MTELIKGYPTSRGVPFYDCPKVGRRCIFYRCPWRICTFFIRDWKYIDELKECPDKNCYGLGEYWARVNTITNMNTFTK